MIGLALAGLGVASQLYNTYNANQDRHRAQNSLNDLSAQPFERYSVNPALSRYYSTASQQAANPYGYSQAEKTGFNQNLGRTINAQQAYATNMSGGNLGRAINFLGTNSTIGALNDFAGRDASLRRSYQNDAIGRQYQGAQAFQNIDNMNTQTALARRMQMLQAYGQSVRQNKDYVRNSIGNIGQDLITGGLIGDLNGLFSGGNGGKGGGYSLYNSGMPQYTSPDNTMLNYNRPNFNYPRRH